MPRQLVGSNLNTLANNGTFENVDSTWGFSSTILRERSTDYVFEGTYAAKFREFFAGPRAFLEFARANGSTIETAKNYVAKVRVLVPSSAPIAADSYEVRLYSIYVNADPLSSSNPIKFTLVDQTVKTVAQLKNNWLDVEFFFSVELFAGTYPSGNVSGLIVGQLFLVPSGAGNNYYNAAGHISGNVNGLLFADKLEVFEYVDVAATPSTLLINKPGSTITNANGPATTDGSITVATTGGAGPFEYSITNGASWQSSATFSTLAAGTYTIRVRETLPEYDGFYVFDTFTVGVTGSQFDFTTAITHEQIAGANDGTITVNVTGSGSPFTYAVKLQSDPSALDYDVSNVFTALAPGIYEVWVKDTYENTESDIAIINSAIPPDVVEVCSLQFDSGGSYALKATTPQTADGGIFSVAFTDALNTNYHFYDGGATYTNINGGFTKPWVMANGRATAADLNHTQNTDIIRQSVALANRQYSFDWEAYFAEVSQLFYVAFYNVGGTLINAYLVWDSDNQSGLQRGSIVIDAATANSAAYIGYYILNQSGAAVSGNYINLVRINKAAGPVKYNLNSDFDYNTQGQLSGNFGGLLPGNYTLYARTSNSCRATLAILLEAEDVYGIHYRFEFDPYTNQTDPTPFNNVCRFDILEEDYAGAIEIITHAQTSPMISQWENQGGQDPFETVISKFLNFALISKTDAQWLVFATANERKFKGIAYQVMSGSEVEVFQGFLTPMLYSEPYYQKENYPVSLTFTDQLANLANIPFSDDSGNFPQGRITALKAIAFCLNKTGLRLSILESVNILANGMDTANSSSALTQAYIDPRTYLNDDNTAQSCLEVLRGVLGSLLSRIYQSIGYWHIDLVSQKAASSVLTRIHYYSDGQYNITSSYTQTPRIKLRRAGTPAPKLVLSQQSGMFSVAETYGTVRVRYELNFKNDKNLLPYGKFNVEDIENGQIKGWQVTTQNVLTDATGPLATFGIENVLGNNAFFVQYRPQANNLQEQYVILTSNPFRFFTFAQVNDTPGINLKFRIYTRPYFTSSYTYFDVSIRLGNSLVIPKAQSTTNTGNYCFRTIGQNEALIDGEYIRFYIDEPLSWKDIQIPISFDGFSFDYGDGECQIKFRFPSNVLYDDIDTSALANVSTVIGETVFNRTRRRVAAGTVAVTAYEIQSSTEPGNPPDIILPNDNVSTSRIWKRLKSLPFPQVNGVSIRDWSQGFLLDDVVLEYLADAPDLLVPEVIDTRIATVLDKTILHGDISQEDPNFKYLTYNFFSNAAGEPITGWYRRGVSESMVLQNLLAKILRGQYSEQRILLSGTVDTREIKPMFHNTIYELRSGRIFIPLSMNIDYRAGSTQLEMIEVLKGEAVVDEGTPIEPPIEPPVPTRVHSEIFASIFN